MKLKKKAIKNKTQKWSESTVVNPLSTIPKSRGQNNIIKSKQNKLWSLISNQSNVKEWNYIKKIN
jgi:hypothetical protein